MNVWDIILTVLISFIFVMAAVKCVRDRKNGKGCCGDCSKCGGCHVK